MSIDKAALVGLKYMCYLWFCVKHDCKLPYIIYGVYDSKVKIGINEWVSFIVLPPVALRLTLEDNWNTSAILFHMRAILRRAVYDYIIK
jgi:hypothetical protein